MRQFENAEKSRVIPASATEGVVEPHVNGIGGDLCMPSYGVQKQKDYTDLMVQAGHRNN
jgi:gamma-glutamyltranspeptidase